MSLATTISPNKASALVDVAVPAPSVDALELTVRNESVREMANPERPVLDSAGYVIPPGRHTNLGLKVPERHNEPFTIDGAVLDNFPKRHTQASTLSELKHQRRMAQRADMTFDLDGDGMVSQTDFFFATRFDVDNSGHLSREERLAARRLMREESAKHVFLKGGTPAGSAAHRVMQSNGVVISEQLDGWTALTRAKMGDKAGSAGTVLPFQMDKATSAIIGATGTAGIVKEHIDVDMDDTDNIALMHVKGQQVDFDTITTKPAFREYNYQSGAKAISELRAIRKTKSKPNLSYDLDGDAQVSQRDYFFAQAFDVDGDGTLTAEEKAAAADAMKNGWGKRLAFLRGGGPADKYHRVLQKDGVVLSEETEHGWSALTKARMSGQTSRVGADGQIKTNEDDADETGEKKGADSAVADGEMVHGVELTENGRIALETVKGAVVDYDEVVTKPAYRPELYLTGARTRSELLRLKRRALKPDATFDLDGDGTVGQADFWFASRYDVDGSGHLDAEEMAKAKKDYEEGYQKRFVTMSSSAGMVGQAARTVQINGKVVMEGEVIGEAPPTYEKGKRLETVGVVPGLDLPADRMMLPKKGLTRTGALAGTYIARVDETKLDGPMVTGSMGIVPGVARAVMHYPDGRQEAYGGYAGGMGAGPVNNKTASLEAVMGTARRALVEESKSVEAADSNGVVPLPSPVKRDANYISYHNETTFDRRGGGFEAFKKAPFAIDSYGGAATAMELDTTGELSATRVTAAQQQLLTRTQLIAARRAQQQRDLNQEGKAPIPAGLASNYAQEVASGEWLDSEGKPTGPEPGATGTLRGDAAIVGGGTLRSTRVLGQTSGAGRVAEETMSSYSTTTKLPTYLVESMRQKAEDLPVIKDDLPHETIKPGALPENARCDEATTRSALKAARQRELKLAALTTHGEPQDQVAMPEMYPAEFNDHHSHGHSLVAEGQAERSKTRTMLLKKRHMEKLDHHLQYVPTEVKGVHPRSLQKFEATHREDGTMFAHDSTHTDMWRTNFGGSALDGHNHHGPGHAEDQAMVPDYLDPPNPAYDPAKRHTMRDTGLHATVHGSSAIRPDMTVGLSAKSPRLIRNGLVLEEEEVAATAGDPFKERTIHCRDQPSYIKRHILLAGNPAHENPWEVATAMAPTDPSSTFRPLFSASKIGGRPQHTLHRNNSTVRNGLVGPEFTAQQLREVAEKSLPQGAKWTHAILDYKRRMDPATATARLETDGKEPVNPKKDNEPMFSSFTADNIFNEPYYGKGYNAGRVGRPETAKRKVDGPPSPVAARNSVYGEPVEMDRKPSSRAGSAGTADPSLGRTGGGGSLGASAAVAYGRGTPNGSHRPSLSQSTAPLRSEVKVTSVPASSPAKPSRPAGAVAPAPEVTSPLVTTSAGPLKFGFKSFGVGDAGSSKADGGKLPSLASTTVRTGAFTAGTV